MMFVLLIPALLQAGTDWTSVDLDNPALYVQGELTVRFDRTVNLSRIEDILESTKDVKISFIPALNAVHLRVSPGKDVRDVLEYYKGRPDVLYAEPVAILRACYTPNDPLFTNQWHFDANHINMPAAWDIEQGSSDVIAAIIDSGIAYEDYAIPAGEQGQVLSGDGSYHRAPDFTASQFVAGYDFVSGDSHPNDENGHGTHVAGTVAQATNNATGTAGMAFGSRLMPIRVLNQQGSGTTTDIASGITWAADHGADVINMSIAGAPGNQDGMQVIHDAIIYAQDSQVVCVAAAGNAGVGTLSYPAAFDECIAVVACDYNDVRASYSQYGTGTDISAPGGNVSADVNADGNPDGVLQCTYLYTNDQLFGGTQLATVDQFTYHYFQGTSMATPHVVGLVALIKSQGISDVDSVKDAIYQSARDLGASGYDQTYGWGMIDPVAALNYYTAAPVADFSGTPTSGPAPLSVTFTDLSTGGPTSWSWDFGDGITSSTQNPVHAYGANGQYTVTLIASNADGSDTATKQNYISVGSGTAPTADFTANPTSGDAPLEVTFTDISTGDPTSWSWDFGDGTTSATQNPVHTYNNNGTYTVSLTATNSYGSDTETKTGYITVGAGPQPPTAQFTANPTSGAPPLAVQFTDQSTGNPTSWSWNFGDGGTSTLQSPQHTYTSAGSYDVTLICSNAQGADTLSRTGYIIVAAPVVAAFTATPSLGYVPLSHRMQVSFTDQSTGNPTAWSWDFGDGGNSTLQNPTHIYTTVGTFTVTLIASAGAVADTATDTVKLAALPSDFFAQAASLARTTDDKIEIVYGSPLSTHVDLVIYNVNGQLIRTLASGDILPGEYRILWNLRDEQNLRVSPGVYFVTLSAREGHSTTKVIISR